VRAVILADAARYLTQQRSAVETGG
jgi:hypothetical protein